MAPKALIDTNIILDCFDLDRPQSAVVNELIEALIEADWEICAATTSCKDVYYILTRLKDEQTARECIQALFCVAELLCVDGKVTYEAFHCSEADFEDGIIRLCAELNGMDYLITRDERAFGDSTVRSIHPARLLELLHT
jgi:predicted nucleic acid-binding protein